MKKLILFLALSPIICCAQKTTSSNGQLPFKDVTQTHLDVSGLGSNTMDAEAADFDADGDLDIILAMEYRENILLINDGTGSFSNESKTRIPQNRRDSEDIAIADFDGDGDLDIVLVSEDDQVNEYYLNDGKGVFKDASDRMPVHGTSNVVETADFNGDGSSDLIIGNAGSNYLLINDGNGGFRIESVRLPPLSATTQDIEIADIDSDGDLDMIEGNETENTILLNNGKGYFSYDSNRLPKLNDQTREVELGDIDNDGDLDIVFANVDFGNFGDPQNRLLLNNGKGFFEEATDRLPKSAIRTVGLEFTDLNGDGYLDLLSGNRFNGSEKLVLINEGGAAFVDQTTDYFPSFDMYIFDFLVADFNGDGVNDVYLCGFRGGDRLLFGIKKD